MSAAKRVGVLTAGGDSPGLHAALRGLGKAALGRHGMALIGFRDGIRGLAQDHHVELPAASLSGILTVGGTILGTSRDKVHRMVVDGETRDMIPTITEVYQRHGLDCLVMLGGGGTAKNAKRLSDAGLNIVHLPKTIDKDIAMTDTTFGFATALEIATEAVDRLHSTAHSHHRILVVELMGHRAGWLTLAAGIAGGADIVLLPEIPFTVDSIVDKIATRRSQGSNFSVVAVAEGARDTDDAAAIAAAEALMESARTPEAKVAARAHLDHVNDIQREHTFKLARELEAATGLESRVTILGYVQRGGTPCAADRLLGSRIGSAAARHIAHGDFGIMVAARGEETEPVPLSEVAGKINRVPVDHPWVQTARDLGTGLGD